MSPLFLYIVLFAAALGICLLAVLMSKPPMRSCLGCGEDTPVSAKRCRNCGYQPARPV